MIDISLKKKEEISYKYWIDNFKHTKLNSIQYQKNEQLFELKVALIFLKMSLRLTAISWNSQKSLTNVLQKIDSRT